MPELCGYVWANVGGVPDSWERRQTSEVVPAEAANAAGTRRVSLLPTPQRVVAQARRARLAAETLARDARRAEALTVALEGARLLALGPIAPSAVRLLLQWLRETLGLFEGADIATLTVSPALAASLETVWPEASLDVVNVRVEVDAGLRATEFRLTSSTASFDGRLSERLSRLAARLGVALPESHAESVHSE